MKHCRRLSVLVLAAALITGCREAEPPAIQQPVQRPAASALSAAEVMAPDGVRIRYEVAGEGDPTLVFIHGWSCDRSYWKEQIKHFSATHRVVAIDLGGHGQSGTNRRDWTVASFGQDVRAVAEALQLTDAVLVGHSMGGYAAAEAAASMPGRVKGVVAVDIFTSAMTDEQAEDFSSQLLPGLRADFRKTTNEFVRSTFFTPRSDSKLVAWIAEDMSSAPPAVATSSMQNLMAHASGGGEGEALARVKAPVRLLNSDKWPTDLPYWQKHHPGIELTVMPGVGHSSCSRTRPSSIGCSGTW